MPFLFTNAFLLAALAGLGIPVLIHLLLKRRNQRLKFSTLRFFETQDTKSTSRRKLRNLFLLLLRLLIFALIVLAFARPYLPEMLGGPARRPRRQVALVLDRSLSLTAKDAGGVRWEAALKAARDALGSLGDDDRAAIVGAAGRAEVLAAFAPAPVTLQKLGTLSPEASTSDLADGIREAARLVASSDDAFESSIVVVSDLQRSAVGSLASAPLPKDLPVTFLPVGEAVPANLAVSALEVVSSETNAPFATVSNFGDATASATAEFRLDGKPVWSRPVTLVAGGATNLDLLPPRLEPGWHEAEVRLKGGDALAADDVRVAAFLVPSPVRVLVVENRTAVRTFEEQSFFVMAALDPFHGGTNAATGRFALEQVRPETLAAKLQAAPKPGADGGRAWDAVVLPAVKTLPPGAVTALSAFVKAGGGLVLFGGDSLASSRFNAEFAGLLNLQVGEPVKADEDLPWRLGDFDRKNPVFSVFAADGSGTPAVAEFTRRHPVQPGAGVSILARFDDGIPLVLEARAGAGRVLFANTSADTAWTDWQKHKSFVPWLVSAVAHVAGRDEDRLVEAGHEFSQGTEVQLPIGSSAAAKEFTVLATGLPPRKATGNAEGVVAFEAGSAGIHRLQDASGRERLRFAVNPPSQESDLATLDAAEAGRRVVRLDDGASPPAAGLFGADRRQREFWRLLLLAAIVLLFAETLISNRTSA